MIRIKSVHKIVALLLSVLTALALFVCLREKSVVTNTTVGKRELPIYSVDTGEKQIAITFDAAWGNDDTRKLLDILAAEDVKATFFVTGSWVENYPDDLKAIAQAGHEVGNHSANHKYMSKLSRDEIEAELSTVKEKADAITGQSMCLFRPPYGDYNNELINEATREGYYVIQWSVDSLDWKDYGARSIIDTVCNSKSLEPGAIILCHNGAKYTAEALPEIIHNLKDKGYTFVTVKELIYKEAFHMDATGKQHKD